MPDAVPGKDDPILFMDVESLPCDKDDPLWLQISSKMEPIEDESEEDLVKRVEAARLRTSLMGTLGRPWMIGLLNRKEEPQIFRSDGTPGSERNLLIEFDQALQHYDNPWFVGHNIRGFDIPFLQARALKHKIIYLAGALGRNREKKWERRVIDTKDLWPRTGADRYAYKDDGLRGLGKLDTICAILGIKQQEGLMGRNVYDAYLAGDHDGVASHLEQDLYQVREVFVRLSPVL